MSGSNENTKGRKLQKNHTVNVRINISDFSGENHIAFLKSFTYHSLIHILNGIK